MAVAVAVGLLSMASSMADSAAQDDIMRQKAQDYGLRAGGVAFSQHRHQQFLESNLSTLRDNAEAQKRFIEANQAEAEADARVQAAAAGVAGDSVDAVIQETERNAAEAVKQEETKLATSKRQVEADMVDNTINADIQKGVFHGAHDKHAGKVSAALGFIEGYRLGL